MQIFTAEIILSFKMYVCSENPWRRLIRREPFLLIKLFQFEIWGELCVVLLLHGSRPNKISFIIRSYFFDVFQCIPFFIFFDSFIPFYDSAISFMEFNDPSVVKKTLKTLKFNFFSTLVTPHFNSHCAMHSDSSQYYPALKRFTTVSLYPLFFILIQFSTVKCWMQTLKFFYDDRFYFYWT